MVDKENESSRIRRYRITSKPVSVAEELACPHIWCLGKAGFVPKRMIMRFRRLFSWPSRRTSPLFTGGDVGPVSEPRVFEAIPFPRPWTDRVGTGGRVSPSTGSTLFFRLRALTTHSRRVSY